MTRSKLLSMPLAVVLVFIAVCVVFFFVDQQSGVLSPQETEHQNLTNQNNNVMEEIKEKIAAENSNTSTSSLPPKSSSVGTIMNLPNVLLAGVQKAGTTTVFSWLQTNCAQLCNAKVFEGETNAYHKEVHFFDHTSRYKQGLSFYAKRFEHCTNNNSTANSTQSVITIDASPSTCMYANRVHDIYQQQQRYNQGISPNTSWAENLKVLMIFREPVSRELSAYNHMMSNYLKDPNPQAWYGGVANKTFDEYVDTVVIPKMQSGKNVDSMRDRYAEILTEWIQEQSFPRAQLLVLDYDEMKNDPAAFMRRIQDFLGIEIGGDLPYSNQKSYSGKVQLPSCAVQARLSKLTEPMNQELYALLEKNPGPSMEQRPFPPFQLGGCVE